MSMSRRRLASITAFAPFLLAAGCAVASSVTSAPEEESASSTSSPLTGITKPPPVSVTGTLGRLLVGRSQLTGQAGGTRYLVTTSTRSMPEVIVSDAVANAAGGIGALLNRAVKVSGTAHDAHGALIATSISLVSSAVAASPSTFAATGTKHWVTVPCLFSELPAPDPHTQSYFASLMGTTRPGLGDYWNKASNGALTFDGSRVLDWQQMPHPGSYYNLGTTSENIGAIVSDCLVQGIIAGSLDLSTIDGISLAFSHNLDSQVAGGRLGIDDAGDTIGLAVLSPTEFDHQASVARTVGMGLGLRMSGSAPEVFDSPWDVMSYGYGTTNGTTCRSLTSSYGCAAVLPAAEWSAQAGWVTAAQVATVPNSNSTYNLDFDGVAPAAGHYRVLHIPIDAHTYYTLEARNQSAATYDVGVPFTGLVLHKMNVTDPATVTNAADAVPLTTPLTFLKSYPEATTPYTEDVGLHLQIAMVRQATGYAVTVLRGPVLSVNDPGSSVEVSVSGVACGDGPSGLCALACGNGSTVCSINPKFGTWVTLKLTNVPYNRAATWTGCESHGDLDCNVTMDQSKHVGVTIGLATGCHCPPGTLPFKCQQLCPDGEF